MTHFIYYLSSFLLLSPGLWKEEEGCGRTNAFITKSTFTFQQQHQQQQHKMMMIPNRNKIVVTSPLKMTTMEEEDDDDEDYNTQKEETINSTGRKGRRYLATCIPGLRDALASELEDIFDPSSPLLSSLPSTSPSSSSSTMTSPVDISTSGDAAVLFTTSSNDNIGMKAMLWSRTAHRIAELVTSTFRNDDGYCLRDDDDTVGGTTTAASPFSKSTGSGNSEYHIRNPNDLYNFIRESFPPSTLKDLLGDGKGGLLTLSVTCIINGNGYNTVPDGLRNAMGCGLTVKDALCDACIDLREDGIRPDVSRKDPDVPLLLVIRGDNSSPGSNSQSNSRDNNNNNNNSNNDSGLGVGISLYRMLHVGSLHKRGYRVDESEFENGGPIHKAAMKETLAAGLLLEAGWGLLCQDSRFGQDNVVVDVDNDNDEENDADNDRERDRRAVLVDPMCGSGTFAAEAGLIAADVAPGLIRVSRFQDVNKANTRSDSNASGVGRRQKHRRSGGNHNTNSADNNRRNNNDENNNQKKSIPKNPHLHPPVVRWRTSDANAWRQLLDEASSRAKDGHRWLRNGNNNDNGNNDNDSNNNPMVTFLCNDQHRGAVELARSSLDRAGFGDLINVRFGDCADWEVEVDDDGRNNDAPDDNGMVVPGRTIIVANPPWGKRLGGDNDNFQEEEGEDFELSADDAWESLRTFLRSGGCDGAEAWVLDGSSKKAGSEPSRGRGGNGRGEGGRGRGRKEEGVKTMGHVGHKSKILGMRRGRTVRTKTAGEDLRWVQYEVFPAAGMPAADSMTENDDSLSSSSSSTTITDLSRTREKELKEKRSSDDFFDDHNKEVVDGRYDGGYSEEKDLSQPQQQQQQQTSYAQRDDSSRYPSTTDRRERTKRMTKRKTNGARNTRPGGAWD